MEMARHGSAAARGSMEIVPYSGELDLELPPVDVKRQDSLYRDATMPAHAGLHGQESWVRTLRLAFQCVGIMYADLGTSPLYVYANTFKKGVGHEDDVLGVLSIIIYSFILFTMIKIVFIALYANDDGDGGTFALYSLISRYAKVCLIPNQQAEDELVSRYRYRTKPSAGLLLKTAVASVDRPRPGAGRRHRSASPASATPSSLPPVIPRKDPASPPRVRPSMEDGRACRVLLVVAAGKTGSGPLMAGSGQGAGDLSTGRRFRRTPALRGRVRRRVGDTA